LHAGTGIIFSDGRERFKAIGSTYSVCKYSRDGRVIRELCEDDLPDNLDDLIQFDSDLHRAMGMIGRWKCFILTENSD
jgi:hypothetical protein